MKFGTLSAMTRRSTGFVISRAVIANSVDSDLVLPNIYAERP